MFPPYPLWRTPAYRRGSLGKGREAEMAKLTALIGDREYEAHHVTPSWQKSHGTYLAGRAAIDEADALAVAMETKWGVGRLRLLVGVELREKFDRQRYLFNHAIWHGELEEVRTHSARMASAWRALDRAASQDGHQALSPDVWEVVLEDGTVAALCRSNLEASAVVSSGRAVNVFTLAEIGRLLSGFPAIAKIKDAFPGASVTGVRAEPDDPLMNVHDTSLALEDTIPF
jgi:hypothetical protein